MRLSVKYISLSSYRRITILAAALFLSFPLWFFLAVHLNVADRTFLAFVLSYVVVAVPFVLLQKVASCPNCGVRLGVRAPFRGVCQKCQSSLELVNI